MGMRFDSRPLTTELFMNLNPHINDVQTFKTETTRLNSILLIKQFCLYKFDSTNENNIFYEFGLLHDR